VVFNKTNKYPSNRALVYYKPSCSCKFRPTLNHSTAVEDSITRKYTTTYVIQVLRIGKIICLISFRETSQWLKFPLNGLRAQSRVSPVLGLLLLACGPACLGMEFPPFLMKQLYRCDSVVISLFVRTGYTTRR